MKILKRFLGIILSGTILFTLAACGQQNKPQSELSSSQNQSEGSSQDTQQPTESSTPEASEPATDTEGGKTLVVYYSATGNTEAVAGYIAGATNGDLFEITPVEPYSDDDLNWTDENSRVSQEYADESLRNVELTTATVDNWEEYDTVFIGYPIWWGIAAWPVDGFVSANDFSGKTVIPFATSSSSGMGNSGELLEELAGTGEWLDGQRFRSGASEADVAEWISELGLTE